MSLYLDASVLVPMRVREEASAAVDRLVGGAESPLVVSDLAVGEFASAMSRLVRMGLITAETAQVRLADFDRWCAAEATRLDIEPSDVRLAAQFVRNFDLAMRMPDAIHAAACQRLGLTLVSLDQRLLSAARHLGITALMPE